MRSFRVWKHPSRYIAVLFLAVAAVSVVVLVWMGVRLMQQDRALEIKRIEEQRETTIDRIIAALEKFLSAEEHELVSTSMDNINLEAKDYLRAILGSDGIRVWPENALLYYPVIHPGREASSLQYEDAERAEFMDQDYERAIKVLRPFSKSEDHATRAGALIRLGRNLKKAGRLEAALDTYLELAKPSYEEISISGLPTELVARRSRCALLEELGNREQLQREAQSLQNDLKDRRWRLDRASYLYYSDQVKQWLGQEFESDAGQQAMADAVVWLWESRQTINDIEQSSSGRRSLQIHGTSVTVLWQALNNQLAAVVAGPGYQQSQWFDPLIRSFDSSSTRINLSIPHGALVYGNKPPIDDPKTTRLAIATGLPWDIAVISSNLEAHLNQFAQRRRLMMMGLGILILLVVAASYFIGRAVSRELAAARLQSDFVSAVSHEFRTPLTSMRQFTEMLIQDESLPTKKRLMYYRAQERSTRRLSRLVESLLDFGRMEAGARPYRLERLDVSELVRSVVDEFKREINSNDLVIDCDVPDQGPLVNADREALAQALWNLLDNAMKYSGTGSSVRVEVKSGNKVEIRVRDQGLGISPSERSRILLKFERGSSAKTCGIKGTGIGLAIVKHIVEAHDGKILINSEPGKGSTFIILLPLGGKLNGENSDC